MTCVIIHTQRNAAPKTHATQSLRKTNQAAQDKAAIKLNYISLVDMKKEEDGKSVRINGFGLRIERAREREREREIRQIYSPRIINSLSALLR